MNGRIYGKGRDKICRWCIDTSKDMDFPLIHRRKAAHQYCEQKTLGDFCDCPECWPDPTRMTSTKDILDILKLDVPKK